MKLSYVVMKKKYLKDFGNYVKERRKQMGLTQIEASEVCCVSRITMSTIERGSNHVKYETYLKTCNALGIDLNQYADAFERVFVKRINTRVTHKKTKKGTK